MQQLVFSSKTNIALPSSFFTSYFGLKVKKQVISKLRNMKKIPKYIYFFLSPGFLKRPGKFGKISQSGRFCQIFVASNNDKPSISSYQINLLYSQSIAEGFLIHIVNSLVSTNFSKPDKLLLLIIFVG